MTSYQGGLSFDDTGALRVTSADGGASGFWLRITSASAGTINFSVASAWCRVVQNPNI